MERMYDILNETSVPSKIKHFATLDADGTKGGILLAWSTRFNLLDSLALTFSITVMLRY